MGSYSERVVPAEIQEIESELMSAAKLQDQYDLSTINLIAPASPTPAAYCDGMPLKHNAIAEGRLGNRPYAGVEGFNRIEQIAADAAKVVFGAEHANVQPHSVSQANQAVYHALAKPGDPILAMRFDAGGHLTHGLDQNFSGQFYDFSFYGVGSDGYIDYDEVRDRAIETQPRIIICGAASYPRSIDFEKFASVAEEVGAYLLGDMSHPAGLIAADRYPQPFPSCDVVTLTLDKTALGPHGGLVMSKADIASEIDKAVHPGVQSSVPLRRIYSIAQCLLDVQKPWFRGYVDRLLENMDEFEAVFSETPDLMVTGGSDTHMMVLDTLNTFGLTGKLAEDLLERMDILTNRQVIPGETQKPFVGSGIRLGGAWITARGYDTEEVRVIGESMVENFEDPLNATLQEATRMRMREILQRQHPNDVWTGEVYEAH